MCGQKLLLLDIKNEHKTLFIYTIKHLHTTKKIQHYKTKLFLNFIRSFFSKI